MYRFIAYFLICYHMVPRSAGQLTARLANGTSSAGRLEVLYNGEWSTVCDDGFDTNDAQVACRMLGFNNPDALFVSYFMYGAGSGKILLDDLACNGTETSLAQCSHKGYYKHNCDHKEDVGVVCTVYRPLFKIKWEGNSCEPLESSQSRCVISQNQNVSLYCEADSNPPPASVRWSGSVVNVTGKLQIISADKIRHNGRNVCIATSEPLPSDGRLTLRSRYNFDVIVKYPSRVLKFQVNARIGRVVTVTENSKVHMLCEAEGRPTPHMMMVTDTGDRRELASRPRGAVEVTDRTGVLTYNLTAAPCEVSGDYRCGVDNGLGQDIQIIRLYVSCAPRRRNAEEQSAILTLDLNEGLLSVQLTAYPTPKVKNILYLGQYTNDSTEGTSVEDTFNIKCQASSSFPTSVICNITTINMTNTDEGLYKVIFSNDFGDLPIMFLVRRKEDRGVNVNIVVGAAVGTAAVLAAVISVTVFIARNCKGKKCMGSHADTNKRQDLGMKVSLEDMKSSGATNNYQEKSTSEVTNMPQEEDIMTEDLYVNTAELANEEDDSDHDYNYVDDIEIFKKSH